MNKRLVEQSTRILAITFACVLAFRFLYPFYFNPIDQLWSDPKRHWNNGGRFLDPRYAGAMDPKIYQLWVYLLRLAADDHNRTIIALFTGLLCAAAPYFWYRALCEHCSQRLALALGILLGLHPSLLTIYGFFMNETITLTATALAMWMTMRSIRLRTFTSFNLAAFCWLVTGFSKQLMLPVAAAGIAYLLSVQPRKLKALASAIALFLLFAIPSGIHTMMGSRIFSPFGLSDVMRIDRESGHTVNTFNFIDEHGKKTATYTWSSPSFYARHLDPLGEYQSYRIKGTYETDVHVTEGRNGWDRAMEEAERQHSTAERWLDMEENAIYFFFGPSWPDAGKNSRHFLQRLNFHLRWLWLPLLLAILTAVYFRRLDRSKMLIVAVVCIMIPIMLLQQVNVMEGRYRKPLEPFILLSAVFLLMPKRYTPETDKISLRIFIGELSVQLLRAVIREAKACTAHIRPGRAH